MKKGSAINKEADRIIAENERKAEQRKRLGGQDPNQFRFRLKTGDTCEVIVLDETPDTVAFYEHNLRKDGHFGHYESCPSEWSNCPLCSSGDNKYFAWFLTVLELRSYETKDGKTVPYSRRLMCIKQTQAVGFKRVLAAAMKKHGTIRGVVLTLERDTVERSSSIGEPVLNDDGQMFNILEEDELLEEYGHAAIKSKSGDVLVPRNGLLKAFDYDALFPKPDAKDIAKRWGLSPQAGSDAEYSELVEEDEEEEEEEYKPKPKSKTPVKASKPSPKAYNDDEDDEEEDDEDDFDEDDDDFDDEEEEKPQTKAKKKISRR